MGPANREGIPIIAQPPMASQILLGEVHRLTPVDIKQLLHVKYLDTVVDGLATNDGVVPHHANLTPAGSDRVKRGQATEIDELPFTANFCKGCAIKLADCYELASIFGCPTPGRGSLTLRAAEEGMWKEMVEIDLRMSAI